MLFISRSPRGSGEQRESPQNHLVAVVCKTIAHSGLKYVSPFFKRNLLLQNLFMTLVYIAVYGINLSHQLGEYGTLPCVGAARRSRRHSTGGSTSFSVVVVVVRGS